MPIPGTDMRLAGREHPARRLTYVAAPLRHQRLVPFESGSPIVAAIPDQKNAWHCPAQIDS
jgi:hypothetical protein